MNAALNCVNLEKRKSPVKGRGYLMFSQRNNPYCELLQILYWQS